MARGSLSAEHPILFIFFFFLSQGKSERDHFEKRKERGRKRVWLEQTAATDLFSALSGSPPVCRYRKQQVTLCEACWKECVQECTVERIAACDVLYEVGGSQTFPRRGFPDSISIWPGMQINRQSYKIHTETSTFRRFFFFLSLILYTIIVTFVQNKNTVKKQVVYHGHFTVWLQSGQLNVCQLFFSFFIQLYLKFLLQQCLKKKP